MSDKKTLTVGAADARSILAKFLAPRLVKEAMDQLKAVATQPSAPTPKAKRPAKEPLGFEVPAGFRLAANQPKGLVPFDPAASVELHQSLVQRNGGGINGEVWLTECEAAGLRLAGLDRYDHDAQLVRTVPNDQLPEYLRVQNGEVKVVVYPGHVLESTADGYRYVRGLCWNGGHWFEDVCRLGDHWFDRDFVAALASSPIGPQL